MYLLQRDMLSPERVVMMKRFVVLLLAALFCLTGCHKKQVNSDSSEMPTETALSGTMTETETATEETIPALPEATEAWLNYQSKSVASEGTNYTKLGLENTVYQHISGMLGSIEQRFYETKPVTAALTEQIMAAASEFCEEAFTEENLYCILKDGRSVALSKVDAADYGEITKLYSGSGVSYDVGTGELELWTKLHEKEIESETMQGSRGYGMFYNAEEMPVALLSLADGAVNKGLIRRMADEFIRDHNAVTMNFNKEHELPYQETSLQQFLPAGDYQCSFLQVTERTFADGTQGAYLEYVLFSRDIPVIFDTGSSFDNDKDREITGMTVTVGVLQSGRVDYFRSCCIHADAPDSVILTDTRDYMEGTTLLSFEDACRIADEALDKPREAALIQIQYAMMTLYQNDSVAGHVLTPVWHFAFPELTDAEDLHDTERMLCIDVDAVTGETFSRFASEDTGSYVWSFFY